MMKEKDVCYIKLFLRINLEKFNRSLLRNGNFEVYGGYNDKKKSTEK